MTISDIQWAVDNIFKGEKPEDIELLAEHDEVHIFVGGKNHSPENINLPDYDPHGDCTDTCGWFWDEGYEGWQHFT